MTRAELILALTQKYHDIPREKVDQAVRLILEFIAQSLIQGERVELRNFGSFDVRRYEARTAHNPRTGKKVKVASRAGVHFKPSIALRSRVNNSLNHDPSN